MRRQQIPGFPDAKSANTLTAVHTFSPLPLLGQEDHSLLAQLGPPQCALDLAVVSLRLWVGLSSSLPASSNEQLQNLHILSWGDYSTNKAHAAVAYRPKLASSTPTFEITGI